MGSPFSKNPNPLIAESSNNVGDAATININNSSSSSIKIEFVSELSSYEAACQQDPELQAFDTTLHQRTSQVISTLAASGIDLHSLSFDTLREVTGCLLDMNQEVVKVILDYKKDIWNNPELFGLVEEYFENSLQTLDFCTALEKCLKKARDSELIIHVALRRFEEDNEEGEEDVRRKYARTLEELRRFKAAEEPFTEEFFQVFRSVYGQQVSMLEKLRKKKKKLDKRLKSMQAWRKISSVIFISLFAAVLICSVVAAAMTAPPVITALAASATVAMGPVGKWLNSLWNEYLDALKGQKEVLKTMQVGTYVTISELDSIRVLVNRLENLITTLLQTVDFVLKDEEEAVRFVIEEIKKKLELFMTSVEELGKQADRCSRDIRKARTVVLQRIIRQPK